MALSDFFSTEELLKAAEKGARAAWDHILYPAAKKLVAQTDNKWDDAGLELAKGLIEEALNSISPDRK